MKKEEKFIFLEHTADIKIKVFGKTIDEIFENCVLALSNFVSRGADIKTTRGRVIEVSGVDNESLLFNFISELIYLMDAESFLASKSKINIRGFNLRAELFGDDISNYNGRQIKAATYSEMYVKKDDKGWEAQFVLDV